MTGRGIGSEELEALIRRHLDFVYAAAVRQMGGDLSGAEDVTQAVMMVLMRKGRAGKLPEEKYMTGWLLRVTRYAVLAVKRAALRRAIHEGGAGISEERPTVGKQQAEEAEVRDALDEALLELGRVDREVVMRRFLRGESVAAVGEAVGMNENTAGRRIARALEKLRKVLTRRGVVAPTAIIAGVMGSEALIKAPAAMAATIPAGTAGTGIATSVAKTIFGRMVMMKVTTGFAIGTTVLVLGTATAIEVKGSGKTETPAIATTAPFSVLQETTAVAGPVREDGTVDYVAAINENFGRGVTPENNGFVLWAQLMGVNATQGDVWDAMVAAGGIAAKPTEEGWVAYQNAREAQTLVAQVWKEGEHPELAAFLKEREKMLALAEEASRRERWWEPATSKNGVMGWIMLPELSPLVDVSRTLAARATLRAGQGDFDGFMRDVMTIKRLSRLVADWATINALVMIRIDELANEAIGTALGRGLFTREQCAKLAGELDALPPMKPMWETVNVGERWDNLDFVASMATGKLESWEGTAEPKYDERTRAFAAVDRGAVDWNAALKRMNAKFDEMGSVFKNPNIEEAIAAAKAFYKQAHDAAGNTQDPEALAKQPGETKEAYTERVVESVIAVRTTWPLWDAEMQYRGAVVQDDMARVVVALAGYRAEKGKWPEKLETLVPAYLKRVPWDPFSREATGAVVNYRVGSDGVLVYSVGPNGIDEDGENSGRAKGPDDITVGVNDPGTPAP